jgi:hypothetical protein
VRIGREEGLVRIWAEMLAGNRGMRGASEHVGLRVRPVPDDPSVIQVELDLTG